MQPYDSVRRDCRDRLGPGGVLGNPVAAPGQIVAEPVIAGAVAADEAKICHALGLKRVGDRQHQRRIRVRSASDPLDLSACFEIVAHRTYIDEPYATASHIAEGIA